MSKKKTHEEFMEEILAIRPNINITGVYQGCNIPIQWFCEEGHECYTSPKMLKKGLIKDLTKREIKEQAMEEALDLLEKIGLSDKAYMYLISKFLGSARFYSPERGEECLLQELSKKDIQIGRDYEIQSVIDYSEYIKQVKIHI